MVLKDKLNEISSEIERREKALEAKKKIKWMLQEMLNKQKKAEEAFAVENLKSDPVYQKAVSTNNQELIQKLKNRSLTWEEYDLRFNYDSNVPAGWGYAYVTKWWKEWLVTIWDNREVFEPIYDNICVDDWRKKGINEQWTSTRWISYAVKWKEIYFFDSYKWFEKIDITWFDVDGVIRSWGEWYVLYKVEWKKHKKEEYILGRNTKTDEISITKKD